MGIGDYDQAFRQVELAAENLVFLQDTYLAHFIRFNSWSDPTLEEPEWVEARNKFRPSE
jgi:hypothetical protein